MIFSYNSYFVSLSRRFFSQTLLYFFTTGLQVFFFFLFFLVWAEPVGQCRMINDEEFKRRCAQYSCVVVVAAASLFNHLSTQFR